MRVILKDLGYSELPHSRDENDCGVRACEIAFGMGYEEAFEFLARQGRKPGEGTDLAWLHGASWNRQPVPGYKLKRADFRRRLRLKRRAWRLQEGVWIVVMPEHVFTIKDGVIYDTVDYQELMETLVSEAYQVTHVQSLD